MHTLLFIFLLTEVWPLICSNKTIKFAIGYFANKLLMQIISVELKVLRMMLSYSKIELGIVKTGWVTAIFAFTDNPLLWQASFALDCPWKLNSWYIISESFIQTCSLVHAAFHSVKPRNTDTGKTKITLLLAASSNKRQIIEKKKNPHLLCELWGKVHGLFCLNLYSIVHKPKIWLHWVNILFNWNVNLQVNLDFSCLTFSYYKTELNSFTLLIGSLYCFNRHQKPVLFWPSFLNSRIMGSIQSWLLVYLAQLLLNSWVIINIMSVCVTGLQDTGQYSSIFHPGQVWSKNPTLGDHF